MIRIRGKIPITIYPTFWLMAALIGYINSFSLVGTLIWIGIIFVSVLFHEFGHAITAYTFGQKPRIELVALGGLTYHDGSKLAFWKQFFIVFNGPLFGFLLFLFASMLLQAPALSQGTVASILTLIQLVNLFWTIVNLVPVMPLDGGQLLRIVLESIFGVKGFRYALVVSTTLAAGASLFFFLYQTFILGALFFLLAFQSYDSWRKTKMLSDTDRSDLLKKTLQQAEEILQAGNKEEAIKSFEKIRTEAKKGILFNLATQYLAFLYYEKGNVKEVYTLLFSIRSELHADALCLLHRAAFEEKDYPLVIELSGECFQAVPTVETALRNAYAHAHLSQADASIGWLQTALREGLQNVEEILHQSSFDAIRNDAHFIHWVNSLKGS